MRSKTQSWVGPDKNDMFLNAFVLFYYHNCLPESFLLILVAQRWGTKISDSSCQVNLSPEGSRSEQFIWVIKRADGAAVELLGAGIEKKSLESLGSVGTF